MRILHLTGDRVDQGGILSVVRHIHEASVNLNWNHTLWVNTEFEQKRSPAVQLLRSPTANPDSASHLRLLTAAWRSFLELRPLLRSPEYDIIHAHSRGAFLISAFHCLTSKRPILFTNHTYANRKGMYRWGAGLKSMHTVALTPNMARHYGYDQLSESQDPKRIHIISACFSDQQLEVPLKNDFIAPGPDRPLKLIGVGILARWKKWNLAIDAISQLPDSIKKQIQLDIWGPTPPDDDSIQFEKELRNQIQNLDIQQQVKIKGSTNNVREKLQTSDIFLIPSTNEPCSVALMEALALGLPAIASQSGGNIDIIKPESTGLLFQPDSVQSLTSTIERVASGAWKPSAASLIRDSVRARTATQVTQSYKEIYSKICAQK